MLAPARLGEGFPPQRRVEEHEHREDFQPAGQHIEGHHTLGQIAESRKIGRRACHTQRGSHVVDGGGDGGKCADQIQVFQRNDEQRDHEDPRHAAKIGEYDAQRTVVHILALEADAADGARMQERSQAGANRLARHGDARDLQSAARAARAGADEHQHHQNAARELRPQVKIDGGESRRRDDGGHLEDRDAHILLHAERHVVDIGADQHGRHQDNEQIPAHLLTAQRLFELTQQEQVIHVEVHAECDHEDR